MAKPPRPPSDPKDTSRPDNLIDLSTAAKRTKAVSKRRKTQAEGTTLCRRGFHKWVDDARKQFDVKQGKLISMQRCKRCGKSRTRSS